MREEFDHIVVGGGSAGCVVAGDLVGHQGRKVLLLEAGRKDNSMFIKIPAGSFKIIFGGMPYYHGWRSLPRAEAGGDTVQLHRANVLGGGSSINVGAYTRGNPRDYRRWAEATGDPGWDWEGLLPYFVRQEGNQRLAGPAHGQDGPLKISDPRYVSPLARLFIETMQARGVRYTEDFNGGDQRGVGYFQSTHYRGRRCSSSDAFLRPRLADPHLTLRTGARVDRLIVEGGRVVGVRYRLGNVVREAYCTGDVLMTAGAYVSPKLLMLSGIGPADHLRACGIDVLLDQPRIGSNLMDHPMVGVTAFTKPDLGYFAQDTGWRLVRNVMQYLFNRRGPLASNGSEACAFINPNDPDADPIFQIYCLGMLWPDAYAPVEPSHGLTLHACLVRPRSRGSVRLDPRKPDGEVLVHTGFLSDQSDVGDMIQGVEMLLDLLRSGPLSNIVTALGSPGKREMSQADIEAFCQRVVVTNAHGSGTCAMGSSADSVLDPAMRLRGLDGLRVMDASAFPALPSANINATVMAAAARGVDLLVAKAERSHA